MKDVFNTAIIGGGASGLLCATELVSGTDAINGNDVIILERSDRVGKKLIATGNGQGNLTNQNFCQDNYYGDKDFISSFVDTAKKIDVEKYFYNLGIPFITSVDGRKFPLSKQASAVLDIIRAYLSKKGVTESTNCYVDGVKYKNGLFTINCAQKSYKAKNVVLAVGGKAGSSYGTDGSSYILAKNFGHTVTELYPALVQLKTGTEKIKGLKGLKEQVRAVALDGNTVLDTICGEVLFTDFGVSGNAVFKISGQFAKCKRPTLKLEFLPHLTYEQTLKLIEDRLNKDYISRQDILCGILNKRIGQAVLKSSQEFTARAITDAIKNFTLNVTGNLGFNYAQVTKGGVRTNEIDFYSMQSKLQKGLYLTGELLDVDGDCGGYNLTFAFVSGIICARAIKKGIGEV